VTVRTRQAPPAERAATSTSFEARDWSMLSGVALTWGASFLLIDIGLDYFAPALVAFGRIAFGALTVSLLPGSRRPVPRSDWPQVALVGVTWMAVPLVLFAVAQQWIDSSLAGMINAATPLFVALVAALFVRSLPSRLQAAGLLVGFLGVVAISLPSIGSGSNALGIVLVLLAALLYGFAFNLAATLQRRHGALPVLWRAQLVAVVLVLPVAIVSVPHSDFAWSSLLAVAALGALGTGLAFYWFTSLIGRVGSTRGSVTVYIVPVVAILLGATLNDESIHVAALLGTALVLAGAYLTSRPKPLPD
jgi:drug/metabolite transporter (DMT)-like permease